MPDLEGRAVAGDPVDEAVPAADVEADGHAQPRAETEIAFTPRQILGGFALLAGLILLFRRRRRATKGSRD